MRPPLPPPGCGGEWKETGRKLVGRDKGSLTEQQTEGTGTTAIEMRRMHNTSRRTQRATPEPRESSPQPAGLCPFLDSGEN